MKEVDINKMREISLKVVNIVQEMLEPLDLDIRQETLYLIEIFSVTLSSTLAIAVVKSQELNGADKFTNEYEKLVEYTLKLVNSYVNKMIKDYQQNEESNNA